MAFGGEGGLLNNYQDGNLLRIRESGVSTGGVKCNADTFGNEWVYSSCNDIRIENEPSAPSSSIHELLDHTDIYDGCVPPFSSIMDIDLSHMEKNDSIFDDKVWYDLFKDGTPSIRCMYTADDENSKKTIAEMKVTGNLLDSSLDDNNLSDDLPVPELSRTKRPRAHTRCPRLHLSVLSEWPQSALSVSATARGVSKPISERKCLHCGSQRTPQWRRGPAGPKTLCNACGVRYISGRLCDEYRPAASPTFVPSAHSNLHRKVIEMKNGATKVLRIQDMITA